MKVYFWILATALIISGITLVAVNSNWWVALGMFVFGWGINIERNLKENP